MIIKEEILKIRTKQLKLQQRIDNYHTKIGKLQKQCKHTNITRYPDPAGGSSDYQCEDCEKWV